MGEEKLRVFTALRFGQIEPVPPITWWWIQVCLIRKQGMCLLFRVRKCVSLRRYGHLTIVLFSHSDESWEIAEFLWTESIGFLWQKLAQHGGMDLRAANPIACRIIYGLRVPESTFTSLFDSINCHDFSMESGKDRPALHRPEKGSPNVTFNILRSNQRMYI